MNEPLRTDQVTESQKVRARGKLQRAVKDGRIRREPCEFRVVVRTNDEVRGESRKTQLCGEVETDAHHDDYSKPLDVRWLCRRHHRAVHDAVKPQPLPIRPGAIISWRRLRDSAGAFDEPVFVMRGSPEGAVLAGAWIPSWMLDELDARAR